MGDVGSKYIWFDFEVGEGNTVILRICLLRHKGVIGTTTFCEHASAESLKCERFH